jgi:hypothetical protein
MVPDQNGDLLFVIQMLEAAGRSPPDLAQFVAILKTLVGLLPA